MLTTSFLFSYMAHPVCLMPAYNFVSHLTRANSVRSRNRGCPIGAVSWATPRGGDEPGTLVLLPKVSTTTALATSMLSVVWEHSNLKPTHIINLLLLTPNFQHGTFIIASMTTRPPTGTSLLSTTLCSSSSQVSIGGMHFAKSFRSLKGGCTSRALIR